MNYSVLIIDDHPLFSRGLSQLIETQSTYKVTGIAKDHDEAISMITKLSPDLAIVDLNLGQEDGLELTKDILQEPEPVEGICQRSAPAHVSATD